MVSGVDDGIAERVSAGQDDGSGERLILEHGGGESEYSLQSAPDSSLSTPSMHFEVSYAIFSPTDCSDVAALAITSTQGMNYQAEACYASSLGRGERTGQIDVGSERTRSSVRLVGSGNGGADGSILAGAQVTAQETGGPLSDILTGRRELDMVMGQADREDGSFRWLQALDLQVLGACRSDERLNPLLRWSVLGLGTDGQLLAHLGQHFKLRELGQLARCLCAPLVSVRVGKVLRHGSTLRPTATRGYLSLTMLPSSELRLSYVGDNGVLERLAVMGANSDSGSIALEELVADSSARTFVLKLPEGKLTYFWQSEKSKARGQELITKMKDLLSRQPTLAELTRIQDSRLDLLASYVHSALSSSPTHLSNSSLGSADSTSGEDSLRWRSGNQFPHPRSSSMHIPWHHMSQMSISQLGASRQLQQPGGRASVASSSSSIFHSGQAWNATAATSLNSRCVPSVVGRPRCSDPVCSSGTCITSASSVSVGYNTSNLRSVLDVGSIQNSWSTLTSIWSNQEGDVCVPTSHSAGLYTSLQHIPCAQGDDNVSWSPGLSVTHSQVESSAGNALPLPTFFPSMSLCSIPAPSPYIPLSTSFLAPYYCPCPLSSSGLHYSFAPSHRPAAVRESSFVQPSTSLISVLPPLLPQSFSMTLAAHQSSVTPLPPASISESLSHTPVLSFLSNPNRTRSPSNFSPLFSSVPSQLAVSSQDEQLSTISLFHGLQASWGDTRPPPLGGSTLSMEQPDNSFVSYSQQQCDVVKKHCWHHSAVTTRSVAVESVSSNNHSCAACSGVGAHEQKGQIEHLTAIAINNVSSKTVGSRMQSTDCHTPTRVTPQLSQGGTQLLSLISSQVTCTKTSTTCEISEGQDTASWNDTAEVFRLNIDDNPFMAEPKS